MYDVHADPYCYLGTSVLKNLPGLRDADSLERFEAAITSQRAREPLPNGRYGVRHYQSIHRHLFQDVYAWAGRFRTVRMAKEQSVFCYPENIANEMRKVFGALKARHFLRDMQPQAFSVGAAHFLAELNAIHPFRDGNGRTQLVFMAMLASQANQQLDLARLRRDAYLPAITESFKGNERPLAAVLFELLDGD